MTTTVSQLILLSGSSTNPAFSLNSSPTTGFYRGTAYDASPTLCFTQNDTKLIISNDGIQFKNTDPNVISNFDSEYIKLFMTDEEVLARLDSNDNIQLVGSSPDKIPNTDFSDFNLFNIQSYIGLIGNQSNEIFASITNSLTMQTSAYAGGVYSPTLNRIYLVPYGQSNQSTWHYIDCLSQTLVGYAAPTTVKFAYIGGVYSPDQDRIYFIPYAACNQANWHYINSAGNPITYANNVIVSIYGYYGGVYSPKQKRIYFVPYAQAVNVNNWHYIDCTDGSVITYVSGASNVSGLAYASGVYSPDQDRIYFVPYLQSTNIYWHYIDCTNGNIVSYVNGVSAVSQAYLGGVYSPTQNRIYLVPYGQSNQSKWHYIDCYKGTVVEYNNTTNAVQNAYVGGVYFPTQNRIYFVPYNQSNQGLWHYIECDVGGITTTSTIRSYSAGVGLQQAFFGGVFSPTDNILYYVPYANLGSSAVYGVYDLENNVDYVNSTLMSSALFNKL